MINLTWTWENQQDRDKILIDNVSILNPWCNKVRYNRNIDL